MSKVDAQRAMREAKYARLRASGPTRREAAAAAGTGAAPTTPEAAETPARRPSRGVPATATAAAEPEAVETPAAAAVGLCGHKSMNGRTCTREAGHAEKNHRYG